MSEVYDFSNDKRIFRSLGGSDRKFEVEHDGIPYILKFSENHAKKTDMSTSYVNNVISEYISSHIAATTGLPVHETVLGTYNNQLVVGCRDFREPDEENMEFQEFVRSVYDSKDVRRVIRLDQIYETLNDINSFPEALKDASIKRYWDTFVVDSLVGNFDRHIGNWGYIVKDNKIKIAPIYDFGSTLLPQLSDDGIDEIINNEYEMTKRVLVFPSPALFITKEKAGKVGYYDMLSSDYDHNCTEAVKRIAPRIDTDKINQVIDEVPLITNKRKDFYKQYIALRKELIIDRAYQCCIKKEYDKDALNHLQTGTQFSEKMVEDFLTKRKAMRQSIAKAESKGNLILETESQPLVKLPGKD